MAAATLPCWKSLHLLHCLNSLRMDLFYNYDHYKFLDEGVPEENIMTHFGK
ncbi:hypothetical protein B0T25DRAFT_564565 [Lasiosphaeria hispida]|uniref:Uncharacterized protein n=1 Tax=Lasiosphaeria hispida TaxID=260671 RepID=A0AAJ0MHS0_9PEZI|nr:hypothetical protein B0T25DRAFT_564565 [Lasiosphaeria hispida]